MSDAITRKESLLKSIADGTSSSLKPITREEQYLAYIAGESNSFPTNPITREETFLDKIAKSGAGGGGSTINVQPLTATENGTYDAPEGQAYDPVTVDVKAVTEPIAITENGVYPVPKGGSGGIVEYGKEYQFKDAEAMKAMEAEIEEKIPLSSLQQNGTQYYLFVNESADQVVMFAVETNRNLPRYQIADANGNVLYSYIINGFNGTEGGTTFIVPNGWYEGDFFSKPPVYEPIDSTTIKAKTIEPPTFVFPTVQDNLYTDLTMEQISLFFEVAGKSLDGWGDITVNVAGGDGEGGGIIDVETLPTENIDENAVYRVTEEIKSAEVYLRMESETLTFAEFYDTLMGVKVTTVTRVVPELPEVMEIPDMSTYTLPIYILEADGKAYMSQDGVPANAMTVAEMLAPLWKTGVDKGWSDDISAETEEGVYCVRGESDFIYQYWKYINGVWSEFISLIDVNELPTENILNNACYHIVNPESENEDKYFTFKNDDWIEWSKGPDIYKFIAGEGNGHLVLPYGMTTIAPYACYGRNYEVVTFPNTITDIGDGAFYNCPNLKIIDCSSIMPNQTLHWNHPRNWADKHCILRFIMGYTVGVTGAVYELNEDNMAYSVSSDSKDTNSTDIYIVSEIENIPVTKLSTSAFYGAERITKITLPASITLIGEHAFYECSSLVDITYLGTMEQWNAITFGDYWNKDTGEYTIHCTDGDIAKS